MDESAVDNGKHLLVFFDSDSNILLKEVVIDDQEIQLGVFAGVCGSTVEHGCPPIKDRRLGCFTDVSVEEVLKRSKDDKLPKLEEPNCCKNLTTIFNKEVSESAHQISWATVDTLLTVTEPDSTREYDRLIGVSLKNRCLMKFPDSEDGDYDSPELLTAMGKRI